MVNEKTGKKYNIAVAGTGYVGLSLAVLLAQHNRVTAVDIIPERLRRSTNGSVQSRMQRLRNT